MKGGKGIKLGYGENIWTVFQSLISLEVVDDKIRF